MTDVHWMSTTELSAALAAKDLSSREAVDHFLDRVDALDGPINSVVVTNPERARAEADAIDEARAAGESLGPLAGVPMTVKDSFSTQDMVTTSGSPDLADYMATEDAAPVAAVRRAGAVVFGKTNLPLWASDLQSYNEVYGTTNNPYDLERTPGGSSGGAAAALACGFTPFEIGSDIGGSIRIPSHMTGIAGHKPSFGIVPAHGQIPGPPGTFSQADIAVAGPMARTVADLRMGLELMAGPDRWNNTGWRLDLPPARANALDKFRVAVWIDDARRPIDRECFGLLDAMVGSLTDAGVATTNAQPDFSLEQIVDLFQDLLQAALAGGETRERIDRFANEEGDSFAARSRRALAMRHRDWLGLNERRFQMRRKWETFFESYDVALLPVTMLPALSHDHSKPLHERTVEINGTTENYWEMMSWIAPAGVSYLPATVVPIGQTAAGLPVGVQIVGPYLGDNTTLEFAERLTELVGPIDRPNGF